MFYIRDRTNGKSGNYHMNAEQSNHVRITGLNKTLSTYYKVKVVDCQRKHKDVMITKILLPHRYLWKLFGTISDTMKH